MTSHISTIAGSIQRFNVVLEHEDFSCYLCVRPRSQKIVAMAGMTAAYPSSSKKSGTEIVMLAAPSHHQRPTAGLKPA